MLVIEGLWYHSCWRSVLLGNGSPRTGLEIRTCSGARRIRVS